MKVELLLDCFTSIYLLYVIFYLDVILVIEDLVVR